MSGSPESSQLSAPLSYEELARLVSVLSGQLGEQTKLLAEQSRLIEALRVELAAMRREAVRDSTNSSLPPSQDGPAAQAKVKPGRDTGPPTQQDPPGQITV